MKILRLSGLAFVLASGWAGYGQTPPPKFDPVSVQRGKAMFSSTCGFCHGTNGKGGEKGPDLLRSVLVLHDVNGNDIGPVILHGRPEKGMPHFPLSAQQILDIANFLHNSVLEAEDRDNYKILNIVTGDKAAGAKYFAANCAGCHSATGDLKGIAAKNDPVTLQGKFLNPNFTWTEGDRKVMAISVTVTLPTGESFSGTPMSLDDFNVALRQDDGTYRSFARRAGVKVEVKNRLQAHQDLLMRYSDSDIHDLTAYLVTLK